ncbi:MAG: type II toxin-antitoxin system VapC family toxin [Parvibaculaceae bacterium]
MTGFVVDASIAVKWYVEETDSDHAHSLLAGPYQFAAPSLLRAEVASALWRNWRKGFVSGTQVTDALTSLERAIGQWHETRKLLPMAVEKSLVLKHHVYDCLYLSLADTLRFKVITADKRFLAIAPNGLAVALSDWQPSVR